MRAVTGCWCMCTTAERWMSVFTLHVEGRGQGYVGEGWGYEWETQWNGEVLNRDRDTMVDDAEVTMGVVPCQVY